MSGAMRPGAACIAAIVLAGCAFEAPVSAVPTSYDFGPARAYARSNPAIAGTVLVTAVRPPAWLEDDAIAYRLLYEDAARTQAYATSRWAAEPAALMTERISTRLAALAQGVVSPAFGARSDFTLRVELEDFSQHFAAPGESRALLRARVTLLASERRVLLAQRVFDVERAAAPNAQGAVKALTEAADLFIEDLVKWTVENARKEPK
jgi:cholesterol transport system auxiliary component